MYRKNAIVKKKFISTFMTITHNDFQKTKKV